MNIRQKSRLQFLLYLSLSTIYCSSIGSGQGGRATHGKGFVTIPKHNETEFALEQRKDGTRIGESSQMESSITHAMTMIGGRMFSKQFLDIALSGVQFGLCFYVAKAIWKVIAELVEEFDTDHQSAATDDHDMPLFSEEKCNTAAESLASHQERANGAKSANDANDAKGDNDQSPGDTLGKRDVQTQMSQKFGRQSVFASSLAMRLHQSGLPALSPPTPEGSPTLKSVQSVMKSLTRTEGRLLSNTLLSPVDNDNDSKDPSAREKRLLKMWNDIGGLEDVKEGLMDLVFPLIERNHIHGDAPASKSSYYGGLLDNPPGVLLYGPPGCGKTMLVSALAGTANARFLSVSPSTLFRKYVGETNINVKALFTLARKISPCIIFIDEMEGLFRERRSSGNEEHEVSRELKTEFMQLWDGIQSTNEGLIIVGATNRPFDVDSAFLRRMPRSFFVGLPNHFERKKILMSILSNVPLERDFNFDQIVHATANYTPSDIREVLRTAALFPLREARADVLRRRDAGHKLSPTECLTPELRPLKTQDVIFSLQRVAPTPLPNEYQSALLDFASKASGSSFPTYNSFNTQGMDSSHQMPNSQHQGNPNEYYVANVNSSTTGVGNVNNNEESEYQDDDSYEDSYDDSY